jgi:exoribonuclease R
MEFDMDPSTAKVVARQACRSVIDSCAKLTYGVAQTMLDGTFAPEGEGVPALHGGHDWAQVGPTGSVLCVKVIIIIRI